MPPLSEVRYQLSGLWLLVRGDARGLSYFDISDDGVIRSFFAFVICLPALFVHAVLLRIEFMKVSPDIGRSTMTFLFQTMAAQAAGWCLAIAALLLGGLLLGLRPLLRPMVVMINWAAIPAFYLTYGIVYPLMMLPGPSVLVTIFKTGTLLAALVAIFVAAWLALRTVVGGSWVRRTALILTVVSIPTYVVSLLETSMGLRLP